MSSLHAAPGARLIPVQVSVTTVKSVGSVPPSCTSMIPVAVPLAFVIVLVCAALVLPRGTTPNIKLVGDARSPGGRQHDPWTAAEARPPSADITWTLAVFTPAVVATCTTTTSQL